MPPATTPDSIRLAVDIGGTFTDVVLETPTARFSTQVLTTKTAPEEGGADGIRIGMLAQDDALDPTWTVHEAVLGDRDEHVWAGDPRIRDVMTGLLGGLAAEAMDGLDSRVGTKSGGERREELFLQLTGDGPEAMPEVAP